MLKLKTILLALAFLLLFTQQFVVFENFTVNILIKFIAALLLVVWFIVSLFSPKKYKIEPNNKGKLFFILLKFVRPLASLCIVIGALLKLLRYNYSDVFIISGIGFLALWSYLFLLVAKPIPKYNPDIIDDTNTED